MIAFKFARRRKADRLLAQGKVADAITLYEAIEAWDCLMVAHERGGDLASAAESAGKAGLFRDAARLFERAKLFERASGMWRQVPDIEKAATALERAGAFAEAAALFVDLDMPSRAARDLATAGRHLEAARLYEQASETDKALEMYEAAGEFAESARLLQNGGDLEGAAANYRRAGDNARAAELYAEAGRTADSAQCHFELGNYTDAGNLFLASEQLLRAAESYAWVDSSLETAAEIFAGTMQSETAWEVDAQGPIACSGVSGDATLVAVGAARKLRVLTAGGELMWRLVPSWGGNPRCLDVSRGDPLALGCDDGFLYLLNRDRKLLWSYELPGTPTKISIDSSGNCVACGTEGARVICLDGEGVEKWQFSASSVIWDVSVSPNGQYVAIATADGSCLLMSNSGEQLAGYTAEEWAHSVSLGDDGTMALATGMQGVELVDGLGSTRLWSVQESSPVHNVVLTPERNVLIVGDDAALLRSESGTAVWRHDSEHRLLGGDIDDAQQMVVLRGVGHRLLALELSGCKARAAECYARAKKYREAGCLFEDLGDYETAVGMFREAGDFASAARTTKATGRHTEAAELYEQAECFQEAAQLFKAQGELGRAADCSLRCGEILEAASLFEQDGQTAKGAELFEQAQNYGRAGELYRDAGEAERAIQMFESHVSAHPDDKQKRFELGTLMEEQERHDGAIEQFQLTAETDEFRRESLIHLGECFVAKEMYEIAIERYLACLVEGEKPSWDNRHVFYGMAKAYHLAGNYREARQLYESILAVDLRYEDVQSRLDDVRKLSTVFEQQGTMVAVDGRTIVDRTVVADQSFQKLSAEKKERYVPIRRLGEGGMGTVYLAEDKRLERKVALKMLPAALRSDEKMRLRIIHEAQSIAQISHPNVVGVFDVGEDQVSSYVSMEYVDGQSVAELLAADGPVEAKECVRMLLQVTDGLGCAHDAGVLHRDMKPGNVMLTRSGTAKITDFGLALREGASRVTMPGAVSGTPLYMAPEQLRGEENLQPTVDVYAVGCLGYELLTGKPPFHEGNIAAQHLNRMPPSVREIVPDVPKSLDEVLLKCLAKDPDDRYPDGAAVNAALKELWEAL